MRISNLDATKKKAEEELKGYNYSFTLYDTSMGECDKKIERLKAEEQ